MLTVALWDLDVSARPPSVQVPKVLRRVGADIALLARHEASTPATVARQAGYRYRACLELASDAVVSVFSRFPLSDAAVCGSWPLALGHVNVHVGSSVFPLAVTDLSEADSDLGSALLVDASGQDDGPWLVAGHLGHDLSNPRGPWLRLRRQVLDPGQVGGGVPAGSRMRGFLSRGIEPRGGGTLVRPGGGASDLVWVRLVV